jgi:ribosomal-protein-alanine N-acetyltransferase
VVTLARFRWWHVDEVLPLERQLFAPEPWTAHHFWSELGQTATRHYLVALDGERVVGYAGLCDYPDELFVQTIGVDPAYQGRGVGAQLLDALLEEAARRGRKPVLLEVRADNAPAQRLYERRGFTKTGVRRGYYPGGVDALVMTCSPSELGRFRR